MASAPLRGQALEPDAWFEAGAASTGAGASRHPLSHELMTPLNAILGNTELLLAGSAGPLSAQARACLGDIQNAGHDLWRRYQTLLLLVQALSVERLPAARRLDLRPILERAFREADRSGRHARLALGAGAGCLWIQGDPHWLEVLARALVNLCREADTGPGAVGADRAAAGGLRLHWPGLDPGRFEPTGRALVERIMALHGGAAERTSSGSGMDLIFRTGPAWRRRRDDRRGQRSLASRA